MRIAAALLFTATMAFQEPTVEDFYNHIMSEGLTFGSAAEYESRMQTFFNTDRIIKAYNAVPGTLSTHAHNKFSTWTQEEINAYNTYVHEEVPADASYHQPTANYGAKAPSSSGISYTINWVTKGAVTPVQNQGQCGSCWTFSTCESLEGANFIATGKLVQLSEQQIVSCSLNYFSRGAGGCNGGNMQTGYSYSKTNPIVPLSDYAYTSGKTEQNGSCTYNKSQGLIGAKSYNNVQQNNVNALKDAVQQQPVSISIDASTTYYSNYQSGILTNASSCGTSLDHAVLIVGWGQQNGTEFWLIKNSWGTSWGESGYVRFEIINGKGMCGCQMSPLYPTHTFMN